MPKISRRGLLKSLAGTAIGASLPWLWTRQARAQSAEDEVPLRVLFVEAGPGVRRGTWEPNVAGPEFVGSTTALPGDAWALSPIMAALNPWKDRITMFENLDMVSEKVDPTGGANAHIAGATHMLTCNYRQSADLSAGVSIDQYLAQQLGFDASGNPLTKLTSLQLVGDEHGEYYKQSELRHSYSAPGQQVPFISYTPLAWDHVFPEPLSGDVLEQAQAHARETSVYNFVKQDYDRLIGKLATGDKVKIEQMLQHRADIYARLSLVNVREANRPPQSYIYDQWEALDEGYQQGHPGNRLWHHHCEIMAKLTCAALHTDTTRVANLVIEAPPNYEFGYTPGTFGATDWHDLDHQVSGDSPDNTNPEAQAKIDLMHTMVYEKVAYVLNELASLQETDGQSLLDHTLVVLYSHIGEGSHDLTRLPWMVIGDAHGALKTGQFIRCPLTDNDGQIQTSFNQNVGAWRIYTARGRSHGDLFATISTALGHPMEHFGMSGLDQSYGVITEMLNG